MRSEFLTSGFWVIHALASLRKQPEGVRQHFDRLFAQLDQIYCLQRHLPPHLARAARPSGGLQQAYIAMRRAVLDDGLRHGEEYYRNQHRMLDAFSAQLRQIEELLEGMRAGERCSGN